MAEQRQERQFRELYEDQAEGVFRLCYFKVFDRERARELMQEAFMKTWEALAKGAEIDNLKAYVYRTAHNLSVNEIVRAKKNFSLETMFEETGFDPESTLPSTSALSEHRIILGEIDKLERLYADVLLMRFVSDLSIREIAHALKESENTISVRIHRALEKLRHKLAKE